MSAPGSPDRSDVGAAPVIDVRPIRSARISIAIASAVLLFFLILSIFLKHTSDGVSFTTSDQFSVFGCGVLIAIGILAFCRPRLKASVDGIDTRAFFGTYKHIDWDLIVRVDFPPKARFARIVLPADEYLTLYAVQRGDAERSVRIMQQLRTLHSLTRR